MIFPPVPFFDRTREDRAVEGELLAAFLRVLRSGRFILGAEVEALERACEATLGVPNAIAVSSGTDALTMALLALDVGPGSEVICPDFSFVATAAVVARLGATPVFVDIDPATFNIDPVGISRAISPRTRAILPVHLFGQCARLDDIADAARGLPIVEDAAQALGATLGTRKAGTIGAIGCFSFFPTKNVGGFGDGGLVVTKDDAIADRLRLLRVHGAARKNHHVRLGGNYRLDALQAALLCVKLAGLDAAIARRRAHAASYTAELSAARLPLVLPLATEGGTFNQYVVRVQGEGMRDRLRSFLADRGVGTEIYYPAPLHQQPCFTHLACATVCSPEAEAAAREALALPVFPDLRPDELQRVTDQMGAFFASHESAPTGRRPCPP